MKEKIVKYIFGCVLLLSVVAPVYAGNNPYADDKIIHYGYYLGVDILSYDLRSDKTDELGLGAGFSVGGIVDIKLHRVLNLRFTPGIGFGQRKYDGNAVNSIPVNIPLYLKWTAAREANFRPYVIVGGGMQMDLFRNHEAYRNQFLDGFVGGGFGCDFYFRWFKLCPEIRYQIGFEDEILEGNDGNVKKLVGPAFQQKLSITFNFE